MQSVQWLVKLPKDVRVSQLLHGSTLSRARQTWHVTTFYKPWYLYLWSKCDTVFICMASLYLFKLKMGSNDLSLNIVCSYIRLTCRPVKKLHPTVTPSGVATIMPRHEPVSSFHLCPKIIWLSFLHSDQGSIILSVAQDLQLKNKNEIPHQIYLHIYGIYCTFLLLLHCKFPAWD